MPRRNPGLFSRVTRDNLSFVIAGLDPAIQFFAKMMDARVKPGHDASIWECALGSFSASNSQHQTGKRHRPCYLRRGGVFSPFFRSPPTRVGAPGRRRSGLRNRPWRAIIGRSPRTTTDTPLPGAAASGCAPRLTDGAGAFPVLHCGHALSAAAPPLLIKRRLRRRPR
jgi:hypothetical protein